MTAVAAELPSGIKPRRFVDRGAIFAGWVGLGMGLVIAISFELIVAVQSIVFILAPLAGAVIGAYANVRSERWRPRTRVLANAAYAGLVTGVGLAVLYVILRLLFIYADTGYPQFNRADPQGQPIPPFCATGPGCTYERYVAFGRDPDLVAAGVTDAASFEPFVVREQLTGGLALIVLTLGGALVGGGIRALRPPEPVPDARIAPIGG